MLLTKNSQPFIEGSFDQALFGVLAISIESVGYDDEGKVITIEAPHTVFTQIGTQRIFYIHEDTKWVCVY